jgi:hypothetical protein
VHTGGRLQVVFEPLDHPPFVARGIPDRGVDSVETLVRLLGHLDAPRLEFRDRLAAVIRLEDPGAHRALCDQCRELLGGFLVHRRAGLAEDDREVRLTRRADGEPAVAARFVQGCVLAHFEPELLGVERLRLVLVVHPDAEVGDGVDHLFPPSID